MVRISVHDYVNMLVEIGAIFGLGEGGGGGGG